MKITKFGHACLIIENENSKLVIDPGEFTQLLPELTNVSVLVITDEHFDHFNPDNVKKIIEQSPDVQVYSTRVVAGKLAEQKIDCHAVEDSLEIDNGGFKVSLNEVDHAVVYGVSPCRVLTIRVDDFLYYPSDSFEETNAKVKVLALPTSGPWFKLSEAIDLMKATDSEYILATHNSLNSNEGNEVANRFIDTHSNEPPREFVFLNEGESRDFS